MAEPANITLDRLGSAWPVVRMKSGPPWIRFYRSRGPKRLTNYFFFISKITFFKNQRRCRIISVNSVYAYPDTLHVCVVIDSMSTVAWSWLKSDVYHGSWVKHTCMHMYACMYVHAYACMHVHACICMHACVCMHVYACMYMHAYAWTHVYACIRMYACICMPTHACMYMHAHVCMHDRDWKMTYLIAVGSNTHLPPNYRRITSILPHVCMHMYASMYMHAYACICMQMYACMDVHACILIFNDCLMAVGSNTHYPQITIVLPAYYHIVVTCVSTIMSIMACSWRGMLGTISLCFEALPYVMFRKIAIQKVRTSWPLIVILPAHDQQISQQFMSSMKIIIVAFEKLRISW